MLVYFSKHISMRIECYNAEKSFYPHKADNVKLAHFSCLAGKAGYIFMIWE